LILMLKLAVAVWFDESLAVTVNESVQLAAGVPVSDPLLDKVIPAGREPEDTLQV